MENMVIAQDRKKVIVLRNMEYLEVANKETPSHQYAIVARSISGNAITLGEFSQRAMAEDVVRDITLWNTINDNLQSEYSIPSDNPEYSSARDGINLFGAKKTVERPWTKQET